MKSKKIILILLLVALSASVALITVACVIKPVILASLEGMDAEIDTENRIVKVNVDPSVSTLKLPKPLLTEEGEIGYEYYRDSFLKNRVESDTVELEYGNNTFYLKVYFTQSPKKFVKYHVIVKRPQPQTPDNGVNRQYGPFDDVFDGVFDFTDSGIPAPPATDISLEDICALVKPYYVSAAAASGSTEADALKKFEEAKNNGAFDELPEIFSATGVNLTDLTDVFIYGESLWEKILPLITAFSDSDADIFEIIYEDVADETFIAEVFDFVYYASNKLASVDSLVAFTDMLCTLSLVGDETYYTSNAFRDMDKEEYLAILDEAGLLDDYYAQRQTYDEVTEALDGIVYSAEVRICMQDVKRVIFKITEYPPEKVAAALKTVVKSVGAVINREASLDEVFLGSAVSAENIVKTFNETGEILYAFLDGFSDMNELSDVLTDFTVALSRLSNDETFASFGGIPGVLSFVAEVLTDIDIYSYADILSDFMAFDRAGSVSEVEKLGYLVSGVANYLNEAYSHLGQGAKAAILDILRIFDLVPESLTVARLDEFFGYAASVPQNELTANECMEIGADFYAVFMSDNSLASFGTAPLIVPLGSGGDTVREALSRSDEYNAVCEEARERGVEQITFLYNTAYTGYTDIRILFDGREACKTKAFVYDPADLESGKIKLVYGDRSRIIYVPCEIGGEISVSDIENQIKSIPYLFVEEEYYLVNAGELLNFDDVEFIGVDTSVANVEKAAKVRVGTYGFGDIEFVFVYYVYDTDNPVITDASVQMNHPAVPVGATAEALEVSAYYVYDYGYTNGSLSECPYEIQFDASVTGKTEAVIAYTINGEKRTQNKTVQVLSDKEYYSVSYNYESDDWYLYARWDQNAFKYLPGFDEGVIVVYPNESIEDLSDRVNICFDARIPFEWTEKYGGNNFYNISYAELSYMLGKCGYTLKADLENAEASTEIKYMRFRITDGLGNEIVSESGGAAYITAENQNALLP